MRFLIDELRTELTQTITFYKRTHIYSIAPYLYKSGTVAGDIKISITVSGSELFSKTLNISEINGNGGIVDGNYFHGYINFQDDCILDAGTYTIKMEALGAYSFSEDSMWGWRVDHENELYFNEETDYDAIKPKQLKVFAYEY